MYLVFIYNIYKIYLQLFASIDELSSIGTLYKKVYFNDGIDVRVG